jgi:hypothetical protein
MPGGRSEIGADRAKTDPVLLRNHPNDRSSSSCVPQEYG